jgi:hypothetical protein
MFAADEARKSPFGYEFRSVAFPLPPQFRAAPFVAVISFLLGVSLLVADFIKYSGLNGKVIIDLSVGVIHEGVPFRR